MKINMGVESMVRNLRYAVRSLSKTPAFTATVSGDVHAEVGDAGVLARAAGILEPGPLRHRVRVAIRSPRAGRGRGAGTTVWRRG